MGHLPIRRSVMDIFCIRGGTPLHGRIALHGAKNSRAAACWPPRWRFPVRAATLLELSRIFPTWTRLPAPFCATLAARWSSTAGSLRSIALAPHAGQIFRQNSCGKCALPSCSSGRCSRASARPELSAARRLRARRAADRPPPCAACAGWARRSTLDGEQIICEARDRRPSRLHGRAAASKRRRNGESASLRRCGCDGEH